MAARLGVVTGRDLAEMCRIEFPKWIYWPLYVINELGIFAIELTEVIGSAVAIELLFGVPLPIGICITSLDVFVLLLAYRPQRSLWSVRFIECLAIAMIIGVGACLVALLKHAQPVFSKVASGLLPDSSVMQIEQGRLFVAMALIGATVMPHNLFLHSHAVKARVYESKSSPEIFDNDSLDSKRNSILYCSPVQPSELQKKPKYRTPKNLRRAICYSIIDSSLALTIALLINMSVLILAGTTFYDQSSEIAHSLKGGDSNNSKSIEIVDLYDAHRLIGRQLGKGAATLFAVALLVAGQCGAVISTIAGQSIMEGFIRWRCSPILRRLITRICAMIPAMIIASTAGRDGIMRLLVFSHVVLGIQVPFAIIPLVWFTGKARIMRSTHQELPPSNTNISPTVIVSSPEMGHTPYSNKVPHLPQFSKAVLDGSGNFYDQRNVSGPARIPLSYAITKEILFDRDDEMQQLNLGNELTTPIIPMAENSARRSSQLMHPYDVYTDSQNETTSAHLSLDNTTLATTDINRKLQHNCFDYSYDNLHNGYNTKDVSTEENTSVESYKAALWQQVLGWLVGGGIAAIAIALIIIIII